MSGCPPIVLVVAPGDSTASTLEAAGFWVAHASSPDDAVRDISDLRPDVALIDADAAREGDAGSLLQRLKAVPAVSAVPLIVIERADTPPPGFPELGPADVRLAQPVSQIALRDAVERALVAARAIRQPDNQHRAGGLAVAEPRARDESTIAEHRTQPRGHGCPACGQLLAWIERSTVAGVEYDYFHWCERGCGLFCLAVASNGWVKLA